MTQERAYFIVQATIYHHFPTLRPVHINVKFVKNKEYYMSVVWNFFFYRLRIDQETLSFSEKAFVGCLVHELIHLKTHRRNSISDRMKRVFTPYTLQEEMSADLTAKSMGFESMIEQFQLERGQKLAGKET